MLKFTELNDKAQQKAIKDYQEGWGETHKDDKLDFNTAYRILKSDLLGDRYTEDGTLIEVD